MGEGDERLRDRIEARVELRRLDLQSIGPFGDAGAFISWKEIT